MVNEELENGTATETEGTVAKDDSQPGGTPQNDAGETKDDINWEQRYKELQAKTDREREETNRRLEELESSSQQSSEEAEEDDEIYDDGGFISRKDAEKIADKKVSEALTQERMQRADAYYRKTYPDLAEKEAVISGILSDPKHRSKLRKKSPEERIDFAVKQFQGLTAEAVEEATKKANEEAEERERKKRQASGLGSGSHTPPAGSEERELSDEEELAQRKRTQNKKRGYV